MKVAYTIYDVEKEIVLKPAEDGWKIKFEGWDEIQPMFNYVLVEKDKEKEVSNGGIFIPEQSQEKPSTGTVVAVGNGLWNEETNTFNPMTVKVGDRILFGKLAGQTIKLNNNEKTLLKETEILAIIH